MADENTRVALIEVQVDNTQAQKQVDKLTSSIIAQKDAVKANTKEISSLEKQNASLQKEVSSGTKTQEEANQSIAENQKRSFELKKTNAALGDQIKDLNAQRNQAVKATKAQSNSLQALRNESVKLKKKLNEQETATKDGRKEFDRLQKELAETNGKIKELDQGANDFKTTVGDYPKGMGAATNATGLFGQGLSGLFKTVMLNPIGLLVGALVGLIAVFKESQTGAEFFRKASAVLNTAMGKLADVVEFLGGEMIEAFSNPKQALTDLVDTIENGIVKYFTEFIPNAIQKVVDGFGALGRAVKAVFEGDFDTALEEGQSAMTQLTDGVTDLIPATALAKTAFEEMTPVLQDFIAETNVAAESAWGLEAAMIANEKAIADQEVAVAKSIQSQKELDEIIKDQSRTFEERLAASEEFARIEQEQIDKSVALQEERLRILKAQNDLTNSTEEDIQRVRDAEIKLANLQAESASRRTKNLLQFNTIKKQQKKEEDTARAKELKAEEELNARIAELEQFRLDKKRERQLQELEGTQEFFQKKRDIEKEDYEEKLKILQEQEEELAELEFDFAEQRAERELEIQLAKEEAFAEHQAKLTEIQGAESENRTKINLDEAMKAKAAISGAQNLAANVTGAATNIIEGEYRKRLEGLNDQLKSGQISEEEFAKKKEALDKQKALKAYQIEKKQFIIDKAAALAQVAIDTAVAVTKVTSQVGVAAAGVVPFIIAQGVAQAAEIATRQPPPPPTFAQGGDVFGAMVGGKLHSEGGTKYYGEDGNAFEVEKGEGIFVTKRSATNKALQLLNDANMSNGGASMFGSTTRFAQEGGQINQASQAEAMAGMIATAIQNMPSPVVKVEDIQSGMVANKESTEIGIV